MLRTKTIYYSSFLLLRNNFAIETILSELPPPEWPEQAFQSRIVGLLPHFICTPQEYVFFFSPSDTVQGDAQIHYLKTPFCPSSKLKVIDIILGLLIIILHDWTLGLCAWYRFTLGCHPFTVLVIKFTLFHDCHYVIGFYSFIARQLEKNAKLAGFCRTSYYLDLVGRTPGNLFVLLYHILWKQSKICHWDLFLFSFFMGKRCMVTYGHRF